MKIPDRKNLLQPALYLLLCLTMATGPAVWASGLGYINVKDHGAAGDGKTDDTQAIREAFRLAAEKRMVIDRGPVSPAVIGSAPTVYFPAGIYLISGEITMSGMEMTVLGDPWTIIRQTVAESDLFVSTSAWRMIIRGLTFVGGRSQLVLKNQDIDSGTIEINNCNFVGSSGPSLVVDTESTNLVVELCKFLLGNQGVVMNRVDMAVFRDCWFYSSRDMRQKAFIENRAQHSLFENICAVPLVSGIGDRWIDNHSTNLKIRDFRFGGEYGGMTPVYNFTKARSAGIATSLVIEDSWASSSGSEMRNTVVYLAEVPNRIELRGNSVRGESLVQLAPGLDLASYFEEAKVPATMLSFIAEGNVGEAMDPHFPELLVKPVPFRGLPFNDVDADTKTALVDAAAKAWNGQAPAKQSLVLVSAEGHKQVTDLDRVVEVNPRTSRWILSDRMDSTLVPSDYFISIVEANDDILWVWNQRPGAVWPHIRITDLKVDLDKTPWLAWRCTASGSAPEHLVMKVRVPSEGISAILTSTQFTRFDYFAYNLKELLGLSGVQDLELKVYPAVYDFTGEGRGTHNTVGNTWRPEPGMFAAIDFIRFEPEPGDKP